MTSEERIQIRIVAANLGIELTEEQMEFASNFTQNTISFSDAGTGKTQTLIAGLLMAQRYHKMPGSSMLCISFTKKAVDEIAARYNRALGRGKKSTIKFSTLHAFNREMLNDAYRNIQVVGSESIHDAVEALSAYMDELSIDSSNKSWVKKVYRAILDLNSSLVFDPEHVVQKYSFVQCDLDVDIFQRLRKKWFMRGVIRNCIVQGDIPLYCLYALMRKKEIAEKWRGLYKVIVVDEFQDLSLLHLNILSRVAQKLIVVGDMKQQIYAFNGACPQIVREYQKMFPDARICCLTKSFRCSNAVSDFATKVYLPNDKEAKPFVGHDVDSEVYVDERKNLDWEAIIDRIRVDIDVNRLGYARDVMFLYRNNASAIPIVEGLYKANIPFRCTRLKTIMQIPIFSDLCALANAAWQPTDINFVKQALTLFPEFKEDIGMEDPVPLQLMKQTGKSLFDIKYKYYDKSSYEILNAMLVARKKIQENKTAGVVLNNLLDVYDKYIIQGKWWQFDNDKEFYFNLVGPVCSSKTYPIMYSDELDKLSVNEKCMNIGQGIRCYTMHSAKGLEADDVYILDCNEGMFPNEKVLNRKAEAGCMVDAATDVRQDRNLLYVAITRAKHNVYIVYSSGCLSSLVASPNNNPYCEYDSYYEDGDREYDDAEEFFKLFNMKE